MDLVSRIKFESKLAPGVVATFRRASALSRAQFLDSQAEYRTRLRDLYRQRKPLDDEMQAARDASNVKAKAEVDALIAAEGITREAAEGRVSVPLNFPDASLLEWADLTEQIRRLESESAGRGTLRSLLVSIEGLTIDGQPATAESLLAEAPFELTDELIAAANQIAGLSVTERGESPWPGTSAVPEAGPSLNTIAPSAENSPPAA